MFQPTQDNFLLLKHAIYFFFLYATSWIWITNLSNPDQRSIVCPSEGTGFDRSSRSWFASVPPARVPCKWIQSGCVRPPCLDYCSPCPAKSWEDNHKKDTVNEDDLRFWFDINVILYITVTLWYVRRLCRIKLNSL